jgi:hypothetical protein
VNDGAISTFGLCFLLKISAPQLIIESGRHLCVLHLMSVPSRCLLLAFDALDGTWAGALEPLTTLSAHQVLDEIAFLNQCQFSFFLLRTFPLPCILPNTMNWTSVTVVVVHDSNAIRLDLASELVVGSVARVDSAMANLGIHPSWDLSSGLPDVPTSLQFDWTGILMASCEPSNHAPLSLVQRSVVSRWPPPRLLESWRDLIVISNPETPSAQVGRRAREALRNRNPYSTGR